MNEAEEPKNEKPAYTPELEYLDQKISDQKEIQKILIEESSPMESVYSWDGPERFFVKRDRRWYVIVAAGAMVAIIIAALTNNFVLIFAIIALVLVLYTLNTIPPHSVKHEITNKGIHSYDTLYLWKNIQSFWTVKRGDQYALNMEIKSTNDSAYRRMILLIGDGDLKKIVTYLVRHIDYLAPNEIGFNPLNRFIEGEYVPLLKIVNDQNLQTKDPKDAPAKLS